MLYAEVCLDLIGGKPDEISFDLETQFRYDLPVRTLYLSRGISLTLQIS